MNTTRKNITVGLALGLYLAMPAYAQTFLYQDNFDGDGIATNTGIGGGLSRYARQGDTWVDNGQLDGNSTAGNDRGNVYTNNSFSVTGGFKLEVTYTINDVSNVNNNRVNIGLIDKDSIPADQNNTTYVTHYLATNLDKYGIGLNMTTDSGSQGLNFANDAGAGTVTLLSNAQTITTGTHAWVLEVDDTGNNWSYSIDGAPATTGTFADGFDLTREYKFFGYVQDYRNNGIKIDSVTLTSAAAPSGPVLQISQSGGNLDFEWNSIPGMQYDLLSSTDLSTSPATWPAYNDGVNTYENLLTNTLSGVLKVDPVRFFVLREEPVAPLLVADFELDDGGFTVVTTGGTAWAWGAPDSTDDGGTTNPGGSVTSGNDDSTNCWGTGIGNPGFYLVPTSTTLRSPVIDLTAVTGAELRFAEALDIEGDDTAQVFLVNAVTDADIGGAIYTVDDIDPITANWTDVGPIDISAGSGLNVRLEWRFTGQAASADYMGWYIDDVEVTPTTP